MKNKLRLLFAILLAVIALVLLFVNELEQPQAYNLAITGNVTYTWELGQDIIPMPIGNKQLDCDDATLYSYIYLTSMGYEPVIMYGDSPYAPTKHTWLEIDGWIYDWGIAHTHLDAYNGWPISYRQLTRYVLLD